VANARVFQIDRVHQVVEGNVGVAAAHARQERSEQAEKGVPGLAAESAKEQVEPHYVGLQSLDGAEQAIGAAGIVKRPATFHRKTFQFRLRGRNLVSKNRNA